LGPHSSSSFDFKEAAFRDDGETDDMTFELRAVSKAYDGRFVLKEVSLTLKNGESVAVLGRSGSGKSTLLRLLAGLEPPTEGQVLIDGILASESAGIMVPAYRRGVSMVFQDLALWPNLTVSGNVLLGLSRLAMTRQQRRARAQEALSLCGIEHLHGCKPSQISGGEQQRAALARAVASQPAFLLFDEPFSGLDLVTKAQVIESISRLTRTQGITLVLVTHEPSDALDLCERGIVLEEGSIAEAGHWADLLREPRSRLLEVFKERLETVPQRAPPRCST
jgi:ABC-type Fe3+/spermidine/putrescine transport system ATPase subunit